ncbi:hypothetical protein [Candidatus Albibeggiatoa sp. nov. BB20]|uniref:InlB B-repeat-containing protein n=1 Tax=Candidatus Albibeggiatoa sp. nov. BB20 TaxID=3162723 RepID=UPI0033654379
MRLFCSNPLLKYLGGLLLLIASNNSFAFSCQDVTDVPVSECEALVAIYDALDGDNWIHNDNWTQTKELCSWYGVSCLYGSEGSLYRLNLSRNQLSGEIPASIGNLVFLSYLDLSRNQLSGEIPASIGNLVFLSYLFLNNNQLSGEIPVSIGNLTELHNLSLNNNQLSSEIPASISNLTYLSQLNLDNNQLNGSIPPEIGNIPNLSLSNNQLSGSIPIELSNHENLRLDNNDVCRISSVDYSKVPNYETFPICVVEVFSCNNVTEIPVSECEALVAIYDALDGDNWTHNDNWKQAYTPCSWSGIECENAKITSLNLSNNQLSGEIPASIGNLRDLKRLDLSDNQLSGQIPDSIVYVGDIVGYYSENHTTIDLSSNQLSGQIPSQWNAYSSGPIHAMSINFSNNQLSGEIPPDLGNIIASHLDFSNNQLSGEIPPGLGNTAGHLNLSNNQLSGSIPSNLGYISDLNLSNNQLTGEIPFISYSQWDKPNLTNNDLCRNPSTDYSNYPELEVFPICVAEAFSCNNVTEIPVSECEALVALYDELDGDNWAHNDNWKQTNNICSYWYNVTCENGHITSISLENNHLSGLLPANIADLTGLEALNIAGNQIYGSLPDLSAITNLGSVNADQDSGLCHDTTFDYSAYPQLSNLPDCDSLVALTVSIGGTGSGSVSLGNSGIQCDDQCERLFTKNTNITLTAVPETGTVFQYWSGQCSGTELSTQITLNAKKQCKAVFDYDELRADVHIIELNKAGEGSGSIFAKQGSKIILACDANCPIRNSIHLQEGDEFTLTTFPRPGYQFISWTGNNAGCISTERTLSMTMGQDSIRCVARFEILPDTPQTMAMLSTSTIGMGDGMVKTTGIYCGDNCVEYHNFGSSVSLNAKPDSLSKFIGWFGSSECHGKTEHYIKFTLNQDTECQAYFETDIDNLITQRIKAFYEQALLSNGAAVSEYYPASLNTERLEQGLRIAYNSMHRVKDHFAVSSQWPTQDNAMERYQPLPSDLYVKGIQLVSDGTVTLNDGSQESVAGNYIELKLLMMRKQGVEEISPIIIYFKGDVASQHLLNANYTPTSQGDAAYAIFGY